MPRNKIEPNKSLLLAGMHTSAIDFGEVTQVRHDGMRINLKGKFYRDDSVHYRELQAKAQAYDLLQGQLDTFGVTRNPTNSDIGVFGIVGARIAAFARSKDDLNREKERIRSERDGAQISYNALKQRFRDFTTRYLTAMQDQFVKQTIHAAEQLKIAEIQ